MTKAKPLTVKELQGKIAVQIVRLIAVEAWLDDSASTKRNRDTVKQGIISIRNSLEELL